MFNELAPFLSSEGAGKPYREVASTLGTTVAAVKMGVLRLRRRFGKLLREEIAHTVRDEGEIEDEIRFLLSAVRRA